MLNQVELGLGRVVAEHAVVVAGIALHRVLVLLQVLWEAMERAREGGREGGRRRKKLLQMADRWAGTTDSLLLKRLINEQINSQSRPRCLTPRPLSLQDNCLDCTLCLCECLNQQANGAGEAQEAHKSQGGRGWIGITSATLQKSPASQTEGSIDPLHSPEASCL